MRKLERQHLQPQGKRAHDVLRSKCNIVGSCSRIVREHSSRTRWFEKRRGSMVETGAEKPNPNPDPGKPAATPAADATKYVGTPAVGTSKAAAAAGLSSAGPSNTEVDQRRRRLVWVAVTAFLTAWFLAFFRFF